MSDSGRRVSKVLVAGPVGIGKSTAVRAISDVPVLGTEVRPSDETRLRKEATTVAMDFGVLRLDREGDGEPPHVVHLYGTPGQRRFDFMWDILADGSAGAILLADASERGAIETLRPWLDAFADMVREGRLVLGVTRVAPTAANALAPFHDHLERAGMRVPVMEADPRSRSDVLMLIRAVLAGAEWK